MRSLVGLRILIVEDEFLVAEDLARHFRSVGAEVIGPTSNLFEATRLLPQTQAAILDINLNGDVVFPLADRIEAMNIPFVFFTSYTKAVVPERFSQAKILAKPSNWSEVIAAVMFPDEEGADYPESVVDMLPKLRLAARLVLEDPNAADRLVERTLFQAMNQLPRPANVPLSQWLDDFMRKLLNADGSDVIR